MSIFKSMTVTAYVHKTMDEINKDFTKLCVSKEYKARKEYEARKEYIEKARNKRLQNARLRKALVKKKQVDEARNQRLRKASEARKDFLIKHNKRLRKELNDRKEEENRQNMLDFDKKREEDVLKNIERDRMIRMKAHYMLFGTII